MRTTLSYIVSGIQFVAVVVGMLAVLYEIRFQLPKDRDLRDAQLHATVATLAAGENVDVTGFAVQKVMALMHKDGVDMTGISFPNVTFYMAAFDRVNWSDAYMRNVEFKCTDRAYELIDGSGDDGTATFDPCAKLRNAKFLGSLMRRVRFHYADLASANFSDAVLDEARIDHSVLSESNFSRSHVSGIQINGSDFSGSDFGRSIAFDCRTITDWSCVRLKRVDLSSVKMPRVRFLGADIRHVDLAGSDLSKARFGCDKFKGETRCSSIKGACLQGTDLSGARLEGISISNADFSVADISGARFKNVRFENVVFRDEQIEPRRFDRKSLDSLKRARVVGLGLEADETPCAQPWRRELVRWKEKFAFGE